MALSRNAAASRAAAQDEVDETYFVRQYQQMTNKVSVCNISPLKQFENTTSISDPLDLSFALSNVPMSCVNRARNAPKQSDPRFEPIMPRGSKHSVSPSSLRHKSHQQPSKFEALFGACIFCFMQSKSFDSTKCSSRLSTTMKTRQSCIRFSATHTHDHFLKLDAQ